MIILADVGSGLSDSVNSSDIYSDNSGLDVESIVSILTALDLQQPEKQLLTVITFFC